MIKLISLIVLTHFFQLKQLQVTYFFKLKPTIFFTVKGPNKIHTHSHSDLNVYLVKVSPLI